MIRVSSPGKIHLLGEHATAFGKPSIIATVDLRITVSIYASKTKQSFSETEQKLIETVESIIKKKLRIKKIPSYNITFSSEIPLGCGLGSSAAASVACTAAFLSFLKVKWDLNLINKLAFEAEKVFHGQPSGGDNSTITFGGIVWFRKETEDLRIIQQIPFTFPTKLTKNLLLINTGTPNESTKEMLAGTRDLCEKKPKLMEKFFKEQEQLVRDLLPALKEGNTRDLIRIIGKGEKNLEAIGVVSPLVKSIIREIEKIGGAAKICGGGGKTGPTGILLCYHKDKKVVERVAKSYNLVCFQAKLGVEGVKKEL